MCRKISYKQSEGTKMKNCCRFLKKICFNGKLAANTDITLAAAKQVIHR